MNPDRKIPEDTEEFWKGVMLLKDSVGNVKFYDLSKYALSCISIPLSNAVVERLFSTVSFVKTLIEAG